MCIICVDLSKRRLTVPEGRRALREMREGLDEAHVQEVEKKLDDAEKADAKS